MMADVMKELHMLVSEYESQTKFNNDFTSCASK